MSRLLDSALDAERMADIRRHDAMLCPACHAKQARGRDRARIVSARALKRLYTLASLVLLPAATVAAIHQLREGIPSEHVGVAVALGVLLVLLTGTAIGIHLRGWLESTSQDTDAADQNEQPPASRRVRAGAPPPLPYSYDGRKAAPRT